MAKMKVHELAKELEIKSKDIIQFLQEKGHDVKVAQSSLEDDAVTLVKQKFGAGSQPVKAEKVKTEAPVKEVSESSVPKTETPAKAEPVSDNSGQKTEAPKKKKTIIVLNNPQNSRMGQSGNRNSNNNRGQQPGRGDRNNDRRNDRTDRRQSGYQGNSSQNGGRPGQNNVRREEGRPLIKPLTKPSQIQMPDEKLLYHEAQEKAAKDAAVKEAAAKEAAAKEAAAKEAAAIEAAMRLNEKAAAVAASRSAQEGQNKGNFRSDNRSNNGQRPDRERGGRNENRGERNQNRGERFQNGQQRTDRPAGGQFKNDRFAGNQGRNDRNQSGQRSEGTRGDGQNRQGYNNGTRNNQGYNRPANGARPGAPSGYAAGSDGRADNRSRNKAAGKNSFAAEAPEKGMEKRREEERRRSSSQDKDRRSRKDAIYENEDEQTLKNKNKAGRFIKPEPKKEEPEEQIKVITLPETITIKELAEKMRMQPAAIIKKLFLEGKIVTVNQEISYEEAENIAIEYDIICEKEVKVDVIEELLREDEESEEDMIKRPPVICVMGHVDHGKTSLLDAIRKTNVTRGEAGGITQHIGAYTVSINGEKITFLDTPGHEAFTAMRMRGANSTDIAVLVVAADDGVMPQTVEAINHAKAANIEIIVAVNKIDKPNASIDRVKQELTEYGLIAEEWGGSTVFVPVSAKTGEGISNLLEMILLTAEVLELKANPNRQARGLVIEAELDKGRGPVARVLVQKGKLHVGDFVSAGASNGKVRAMIDDKGKRVKEAGPSTPVEILGLSDVPAAGDVFLAHESDKEAKSYAAAFIEQNKEKKLEETKSRMSLDDLFNQIQEGNLKELNLIIKADVQGSVEAVKQSLLKLSNEEVVVKCIHGGVGAINESDVSLAATSNAIIIGFNVRPDVTAKATAEREGVDVRLYKVIYQAIEDVEAAMKGMLDPVYEEKIIGHAEVRQIFKASAVGNIAGSYVLDGIFQRGCKVRITREGEQIYEGALASLKRFKDDVKEVKSGYECGLVFEGFDKMQEWDIVEAYTMVEVPR